MQRRDFFKAVGATAAAVCSNAVRADNASGVLVQFQDANNPVEQTEALTTRSSARQTASTTTSRPVLTTKAETQNIALSGFTHQSPLWLRRGNEEFRFDASTPEGYRAAMWLMRDIQSNRVGYPHPYLLQALARAQNWLAAYAFHIRFDVTSGMRTLETNQKTEGAARSSLHQPNPDGWFFATDFRGKNLDATYTAKLMQAVGAGGVGLYWQREFVHADIGRPRTWVKK